MSIKFLIGFSLAVSFFGFGFVMFTKIELFTYAMPYVVLAKGYQSNLKIIAIHS